MLQLIALLIGVTVGAVMGMTGAGGGILAVPALVEAMGWQMQQAMPVALLAVTAGAAVGAIEGFRKNLVRYRAALLMALIGMPLTSVGVLAAQRLPQVWLMGLFAAILFFVASRLFSRRMNPAAGQHSPTRVCINSSTGRFEWTWITSVVIASIGGIAGLVTGLLGVGGGFVIVPMLRHYTNLSMHGAIATSLFVIALVGSAGVGSAVLHGAVIPLQFTTFFVLSTILGMLLGRRAARLFSETMIQTSFACLLLSVACLFAYRVIVLL